MSCMPPADREKDEAEAEAELEEPLSPDDRRGCLLCKCGESLGDEPINMLLLLPIRPMRLLVLSFCRW